MSKRKNLCVMGCDREVKYVKSQLCNACYQAAYYWKRQGVTAMMQYAQALEFRAGRLEHMTPAKVTRINNRRKRA